MAVSPWACASTRSSSVARHVKATAPSARPPASTIGKTRASCDRPTKRYSMAKARFSPAAPSSARRPPRPTRASSASSASAAPTLQHHDRPRNQHRLPGELPAQIGPKPSHAPPGASGNPTQRLPSQSARNVSSHARLPRRLTAEVPVRAGFCHGSGHGCARQEAPPETEGASDLRSYSSGGRT
jgi:hypothetical protein